MYKGKLTALLYTEVFRGDHSADIIKSIDISDDMTVGELRKFMNPQFCSDYIKIIPEAKEVTEC